MTKYTGQADYRHGTPARTGVLLVNLGTPDAPTTSAVRRFLAEFLWDPRVIELPRPLWWLALHGFILRVRPARSAAAYRQIWTAAGSPLLTNSLALAAAVERQLAGALPTLPVVALAMTYGRPSIAGALEELRAANVRHLLVLPLYPQYSASTTASIFDRVSRELRRWRWLPELRFVNDYHDDRDYLAAVADSISATLKPDSHLLFSFHGLPRRYLLAGDPYHCQCQATARMIAGRLGLPQDAWSVSFQSRVGRERWLEPYTDQLLAAMPAEGIRRVTVVCPGFAVDCLETLEEIAIRNRADFLAAGGEVLEYVPALNDRPGHAACLALLARRHLGGWPGTAPEHDEAQAATERAEAAARALALGAPR